jgi:hypothetical protein
MQKFELKLRRRDIPEQELLEDIRSVAEQLQLVAVTRVQYDQKGQFGATTVIRRFGSWNKALSAAKLPINTRQDITFEELFENLATVWTTLGRQPFGSDMDKANGISKIALATYEKRFGSWNKALVSFVDSVNGKGNFSTHSQNEEVGINVPASKQGPRSINWRMRAMVLIKDNCICKMCGASPAKNPEVVLHVDHVVPWSKGGATVPENLQTLCSVCNIGKSDILL